jgi:Uma2 family endonuclease
MSTILTPSPPTPSEPGFSGPIAPYLFNDLYRLNVEEYERMAEAGVLAERRVELIGGYLVKKMVTKPPHVWTVDATREAIERLIGAGWHVREEKPVRIPEFDEPEPDIAVVRGTRDDYSARHPGPGDIGLLVEISDSSLSWDRGAKMSAYARARIPTYVVVNLIDRQIEVYSDPQGDSYQIAQTYGGDAQFPVVLAGVPLGEIAVSAIMPPVNG